MPGFFLRTFTICYEDTVFDLTADLILKTFDVYIYMITSRRGREREREREEKKKRCRPENS